MVQDSGSQVRVKQRQLDSKKWLVYALATTICWGVWGALIEIPEKAGFPATLGYCIWSLTMIPVSVVAMRNNGWKLKTGRQSITYGGAVGLLGALGQLALFQALRVGPAYIVFPIVSLSPVATIMLSYTVLRERVSRRSWVGIFFAILALPLLSYQSAENSTSGYSWILLVFLVFLCWGVQGYFFKVANRVADSSSIFFYMTAASVLLTPLAILATDFQEQINWGLDGPYLAALIQLLNSVGALLIISAFRYGKAMIVSPLINAGAPIITILLSLTLYAKIPGLPLVSGMALAAIAIFLMAEE